MKSILSKIVLIIFGIAFISFFGFFILLAYILFLLYSVFFNKKSNKRFFDFGQTGFNFQHKAYKQNKSTHTQKTTVSSKSTYKPSIHNNIKTVKRNLTVKDGEISS